MLEEIFFKFVFVFVFTFFVFVVYSVYRCCFGKPTRGEECSVHNQYIFKIFKPPIRKKDRRLNAGFPQI